MGVNILMKKLHKFTSFRCSFRFSIPLRTSFSRTFVTKIKPFSDPTLKESKVIVVTSGKGDGKKSHLRFCEPNQQRMQFKTSTDQRQTQPQLAHHRRFSNKR